LGTNPYIDGDTPPPPRLAYTLTVREGEAVLATIAVDPEALPLHEEGLPGSILSLLLANGIELDHTCGGVCACSTCHVYLRQGFASAPEPIEEEEDQLDFAPGLEDSSRLGCQCVPDGSVDVVVEVPTWKRNEVSEDPH